MDGIEHDALDVSVVFIWDKIGESCNSLTLYNKFILIYVYAILFSGNAAKVMVGSVSELMILIHFHLVIVFGIVSKLSSRLLPLTG